MTMPETDAHSLYDAAPRLTIDVSAVVRNWRTLAATGRSETAAVVKANAYGLGIEAVAPPLARAGCKTFFVAMPSEGFALRELLPDATIYVLNGVFERIPEVVEARLIPFISSFEALSEWPIEHPFALNTDTGMHRLGLRPHEAIPLARTLRPALLSGHFACADTPGHPLNTVQEENFAKIREAFATTPASLANSAAHLTRPHTHYDLSRPGIALYGGRAALGTEPLEPTVRLETRIILVREGYAGETVGYGAAETLTRDSRIAIVSGGYADGFIRAAGGSDTAKGAPAHVNGHAVRLIGRVSMDLIAVDVTDAPCSRGDWIELFGKEVPLDDAADAAGTIPYELLTGLSRRASRHYGPL